MSDKQREDLPSPEGAPDDDLEPLDLEELRAARELARAVDEGAGRAGRDVEEALRGAATVAAARTPELDADARDRIADELFRQPAPKRRRMATRLGIAASLAAAAVFAVLVRERSAEEEAPQAAAREADTLRREAEALVAELLPPGGSPAARAHSIAQAAQERARAAGGSVP